MDDFKKKYNLKGKRVLVTGSNGFIGKHLVKRLAKEEAEIYCIDINKNKSKQEVTKRYIVNIGDFKKLEGIIKKINPEIIFHLAAIVNPSRKISLIKETYDANLYGTVNMLMATKNINYDLFIYSNTSEHYGNENKPPFNEEMKIKAMSPYSASKIGAEIYCNLFSEEFKKPVVILRISMVYGSGQRGERFIPNLMKSIKENKECIMTGGKQSRDFIYIDDVIEAFILCCYKKGIKGTFNLGFGKETQLKEIIEILQKQIKINVKFDKHYRKNEIWNYYLDISKIKKELDWEPKVDLKEGLKKTLEWWKRNE